MDRQDCYVKLDQATLLRVSLLHYTAFSVEMSNYAFSDRV